MTTPVVTLEIPIDHGCAIQSFVLKLGPESKPGRRLDYSAKLMNVLRNVRVGRRKASMSVPDDAEALSELIGIAGMLKTGVIARMPKTSARPVMWNEEQIISDSHYNYVKIIETHLTRALEEVRKSPLERLAGAAE